MMTHDAVTGQENFVALRHFSWYCGIMTTKPFMAEDARRLAAQATEETAWLSRILNDIEVVAGSGRYSMAVHVADIMDAVPVAQELEIRGFEVALVSSHNLMRIWWT